MNTTIMNYLEVMVDDEEVVRNQLDRICGKNQDLFSHTKIQRHRVLVDTMVRGQEEANEKDLAQRKDVNIGLEKDAIIKSKILTHFIKGKISLTPMETI